MTRKDYVLIAGAVKEARDASHTPYLREGIEKAASHIATALQFDNPRFDRDRFLKACGVKG